MPLKLVRRPKTPFWIIRGTLRGIRVEESTGTGDRKYAEEIRAKREAEILTQSVYGRRATTTFAEAAVSYLENGGSRRFLQPVIRHFGTTALAQIGQEAIEAGAVKLYPKAQPATRNRQFFTPAVAVLRHAAKRGWCERPLIGRPKKAKRRLRWLRPDEAERLIAAAGKSIKPMIIFMMYTGARAAEAVWLDWRDVDLQRAQVTFPKTKNGDARSVPLVPRVVATLANLKGRDGEVFRRPNGKPYTRPKKISDTSAGKRIRKAFRGAVARAGLGEWMPHSNSRKAKKGVMLFRTDVTPHITRHTWATWHYQQNRNLGALMELGGWRSVQMVMRYTHVNVGHLSATMRGLPGGDLGDAAEAPEKKADGTDG